MIYNFHVYQTPPAHTDCIHSNYDKLIIPIHREVKDRDGINEFLRNEIRLTDMRDKAKETLEGVDGGDGVKLDVLIQREQTISQMESLLSAAIQERDRATTELE